MGRFIRPLFVIVLWLAVSVQSATAQTYPLNKSPYVNDYASLLSASQGDEIARKLADLRKFRDIEMTVLTIDRRSDYGQDVSNEVFATNLFNAWGLGDRNRNDGILFFVSRFDREMRIEVGRGYGRTKDDALKRIIDKIIIPEFRLNTYDTGIINGVDHTIRETAGFWPDQYDASAVTRWWTDLRVWAGGFLFAIFAPIGWIVWRAYHATKRRAPRRCPIDGSWMPRVLEEFEVKHLSEGQQKEERLASKEYDVWICRECEHVTIEGFGRWFSKQNLCKKCGFHTLESYNTERTIEPTYSRSGELRTDFQCNHCAAHYSTFATLPILSDSDSSSGSSGGGSSSGGGASGSW